MYMWTKCTFLTEPNIAANVYICHTSPVRWFLNAKRQYKSDFF
jgi:hypothetical protein